MAGKHQALEIPASKPVAIDDMSEDDFEAPWVIDVKSSSGAVSLQI
jgi:hypothetical protein